MFFPFRDNVPSHRLPLVTCLLIGINVLVFVSMLGMAPVGRENFAMQHGFVPARLTQLRTGQDLQIEQPAIMEHPNFPGHFIEVRHPVRLPPDAGAVAKSLLTCMFLHGGWLHLLGNMWFLWLFGDNVEDRLGHIAYLALYLVGGVAASLFHYWMNATSGIPIIGASGAVAAVLGAYAITWPHARIHCFVFLFIFITVVDLPALAVLGFWFVTQIVQAWSEDAQGLHGGVAWWAHIGGFIVGMGLMWLASAIIPEDRSRPLYGLEEEPEDADVLDGPRFR